MASCYDSPIRIERELDIVSELREREIALLLDVSAAGNSARACHLVDEFVGRLGEHPQGVLVDLNAGDLLLTRGILTKIRHQLERAGASLGTVYSTVPQTQQAALDEGVYVKEKLKVEWRPLRTPLPATDTTSARSTGVTPPVSSQPNLPPMAGKPSVDLPDFNRIFTEPASPPQAPPDLNAEAQQRSQALPPVINTPPVGTEVPVEDTPPVMEEVQATETAFETLYLRQTMRSGQFVRFNGNVVIIGDVHAGSEVIAGGDIVVWGDLKGIAHAGAHGNYKAEIRAMKIEALQLRIADYIARRPDRIYYHKDGSESAISPELAKVADGEIKVFKNLFGKTERM